MFVMCRFPYSAVEKPEYRAFTGSCTSAKSLSELICDIHREMKESLGARLRNTSLTLAVDGWTGTRQDKVVNIVALSEASPYFLRSFFLEDRETGAVVAGHVADAMDDVAKAGGFVSAIVTDNAENMNNAYVISSAASPELRGC
jgi:hypothetical protein